MSDFSQLSEKLAQKIMNNNYNTIDLFFTIYPLRLERVLFNYKVHEASDCDAAISSAN